MKALVVGFDGFGYSMFKEHSEVMPFYQKIMDSGVFGFYESEYQYTYPSWSSIYTGLTQDRHGIIEQDGKSHLRLFRLRKYWDVLGRSFKVGVFAMPLTYPVMNVNGWMVAGFLTPVMENWQDLPLVYPLSLKSCLEDYFPTIDHWNQTFKVGLERKMIEVVYETAEQVCESKLATLNLLLDKAPVDFLSVGFTFPDFIHHSCGQSKEKDEWAVPKVCELIDKTTRSLVYTCKPERFLVCSDHGWRHQKDASLFIGGEGVRNMRVPSGVHEYDVFALILKLCRLEVPSDVDGKGFTFFEDELSGEELEGIKKQLRALGYID